MNGWQTTAVVWVIFTWVVLVPFSLSSIYKYYVHRNDPYIRGRQPQIALIWQLSALFCVAVVYNIQLCVYQFLETNNDYVNLPVLLNSIFAVVVGSLRQWHIVHEQRYNQLKAGQLWQEQVTDVVDNTSIANRSCCAKCSNIHSNQSLGDTRVTMRAALAATILLIICTIVLSVSPQRFHIYAAFLIQGFALASLVIFGVMIVQISRVKDLLYIREESFLTALMLVLLLTCYGMVYALWMTRSVSERGASFLFVSVPSLCWIGLVHVSSTYILYHRQVAKRLSSVSSKGTRRKPVLSASGQEIISKTRTGTGLALDIFGGADHVQISTVKLDSLLSTEDGFQIFMEHLLKEFSAENLFYWYTVNQFKAGVLKQFPMVESHVTNVTELPHSFPQCAVLSKHKSNIVAQYLAIFEQYIGDGWYTNPTMEINCSHGNRQNCWNLYQKVCSIAGIENITNGKRNIRVSKSKSAKPDEIQTAIEIGNKPHPRQFRHKTATKAFSVRHLFTGRTAVKPSDQIFGDSVESLLSDALLIELIQSLDEVMRDITQNMRDSFMRFKRTPVFIKWARVNAADY